MCPLRIILIFLSATLAGFFVLRNLNSSPDLSNDAVEEESDSSDSTPLSSKVHNLYFLNPISKFHFFLIQLLESTKLSSEVGDLRTICTQLQSKKMKMPWKLSSVMPSIAIFHMRKADFMCYN